MENRAKRIIITGAAGFIGTALARFAIQNGHQVIAVDNFERGPEHQAWNSIPFLALVNRNAFADNPDYWLNQADCLFHLGARTDTFCLDTQQLHYKHTTITLQTHNNYTTNTQQLHYKHTTITTNTKITRQIAANTQQLHYKHTTTLS